MNKYKLIFKDHSDTIIEADYILLVHDTTCFYRTSVKGMFVAPYLVGTASKENAVVQMSITHT